MQSLFQSICRATFNSPGCNDKNTNTCNVCKQHSQDGEIEYLKHGYGKMTCPKCCSIAIKNSEEFKPIIENVHNFYEDLKLTVDRNIPILLVDGNEMRTSDEKGCMVALGLTTYNRTKYSWIYLTLAACFLSKLRISVLSGLPDLATGGILAHEMMHAWLKLQGCEQWKWEKSVEEGICQVMQHKWLEWFCSSIEFDTWYKTNEQAQYAKKLKAIIVLGMETSTHKVYGQGFRDARKAVDMYGFEETLHYIVKNGKLPRSQPPPVPIPRIPGNDGWKATVCVVASFAFFLSLKK